MQSIFRSLNEYNDSQSFIPALAKMIGNTPLVDLDYYNNDVRILAKAEWMNPGGSIKDRAAWSMILDAWRNGRLDNGQILLDASSGNTGIALAMLGSSIGHKVEICLPRNASSQRIDLLSAYGAKIVFTDPLEGTDGAILEAQKIYRSNPEKYCYIDQYNNDANWMAHYLGTAEEIISQTGGRVTHFIAGLGTSGTFVGTSRKLREKIDNIKVISVQPSTPFHGLEGLKHMGSALVPGIYDNSLADENVEISTEDALSATRLLTREKGMLVGPSSGAAYAASLRIAETIDKGTIVTIFPDRGERYLGEMGAGI